ncbi:hypothetical protein [Acrocarpospora sp. B8E8]|uniref:hypothetical protein n=1 Tax=Acrocarpospora sp. B8E8 TaxID=3153572 RepID=UPI00325F254D
MGGVDAGFAAGAVRPGGGVADREPGVAAGRPDAGAAVTNVRAERLAAVNDHLVEQTPVQMRRGLLETLVVPTGKKVSPLEWMRTAVALVSGAGKREALNVCHERGEEFDVGRAS